MRINKSRIEFEEKENSSEILEELEVLEEYEAEYEAEYETEDEDDVHTWSNMPEAIKDKILQTLGLFCGGGLLLFAFILINRRYFNLWICTAMMVVFGIVTSISIYLQYSKGLIEEVEGVIIEKEKNSVLRAAKKTLKNAVTVLVQAEDNVVYQITLYGSQTGFKEGQTVKFYSPKDKLNNFKDGVYVVNTIYAVQRVNVALTEEELEELKTGVDWEEDDK